MVFENNTEGIREKFETIESLIEEIASIREMIKNLNKAYVDEKDAEDLVTIQERLRSSEEALKSMAH